MDTTGASREAAGANRSAPLWRALFVAVALAYAVPVGWETYERLVRVSQQARERLILEHRLWELQPAFSGKPENWARLASRLLSDRQLVWRLSTKYGAQSEHLGLEYRRDLTIARAEVVVLALVWWALPLGVLYGIARLVRRRNDAPPRRTQPPSASDPRYLPPRE